MIFRNKFRIEVREELPLKDSLWVWSGVNATSGGRCQSVGDCCPCSSTVDRALSEHVGDIQGDFGEGDQMGSMAVAGVGYDFGEEASSYPSGKIDLEKDVS